MPNRLSKEKSPYLLQHAGNPVDWYAWGDEPLQKAREEDKPIFLSIGYATCHWCHVMAHESFEDQEVAQILNDHFISIKVDREERPDVDRVYMTVCQAMTGRGGWPLSVFMTAERKPFFSGTYFPTRTRMGMPGFLDILKEIARLWENDRNRLTKLGEDITRALQPKSGASEQIQPLTVETLNKGYIQLSRAFDPKWGGFGDAPKFPTPHHLTFLLRWYRRTSDATALAMVEKTLEEMRNGGIFDQVGYGFSRYSVDEKWLVPHFEKMLYDQAMLAMAYMEAFQATSKPLYARVIREIFDYVLRDMRDPDGGFYSAEDADSEGKEGWYYLWTPEQVHEVLGPEPGELFCHYYNVASEGNFEHGRSIPHITFQPQSLAQQKGMDVGELERQLEESRQKLFAVREQRIHPLKDDKILTAWNGLMIAALAKGYQALGDENSIHAARRAADFILGRLRSDTGRLYRRYRHGEVAFPGFLDDYAFLVWGLIEVYESTLDVRYLEEAVKLNRDMLELFWDEEAGGLFYSAEDNEQLIVRDKEIYDGATPSGNSVAALNLLRLGRMTGDTTLEEKAEQLLRSFSGLVADYPMAYTQFLNALDFALGPAQEVVIAGDRDHVTTQAMVDILHRTFCPNRVLMLKPGGMAGTRLSALCGFAGALEPIDGQPAAYICENFACKRPITDIEELKSAIAW
jgi:uncharacterized protein